MNKKYYIKEGKILRTKDDKHIADIKDGKPVPTAPAYYKILEELEAVLDLADGEKPEVVETEPEAKPVETPEATNEDNVTELPANEPSTKMVTTVDPAIEAAAGVLYDTYCDAVGGKAFNGDPLPSWEDLAEDPNKLTESNAWRMAALKMVEMFKTVTPEAEKEQGSTPEMATAPVCDPYLGDRTPAFVTWLIKHNPKEAKRRYEGRGVEAFNQAQA